MKTSEQGFLMVHFVFALQRGSTFLNPWMIRYGLTIIPNDTFQQYCSFPDNQQIVFGFRAGSSRVVIRTSISEAVPKFLSQIEKRAVEEDKLFFAKYFLPASEDAKTCQTWLCRRDTRVNYPT